MPPSSSSPHGSLPGVLPASSGRCGPHRPRHLPSTGRLPGSLALPWLMAALLAVGCGDEEPAVSTPPAPSVAAWTVTAREMETERRWTGRLEPLRTLTIQAPREGRVESIGVREGDRVERGRTLARLVTPDLEARLEVLRDRRDQLQAELQRWEGLQARGAAGPGEVAAARLRLLEARESLAEAEALDRSQELRAPAPGAVHGIRVSAGSTVERGELILFLDAGDTWGTRIPVAAWEAPMIQDLAALTATDSRGRTMAVDRTSLSAGVHEGFLLAEIHLQGDTDTPRAVDIVHREVRSALLVPWTAVAGDRDAQWVGLLVPENGTEFHVVERREVTLGEAWAEGVEVLSGIEDGDRILRYEPRSHPEGRQVRIAQDAQDEEGESP